MVLNSLIAAWIDSRVPHTLDRGHNSTTHKALYRLQYMCEWQRTAHISAPLKDPGVHAKLTPGPWLLGDIKMPNSVLQWGNFSACLPHFHSYIRNTHKTWAVRADNNKYCYRPWFRHVWSVLGGTCFRFSRGSLICGHAHWSRPGNSGATMCSSRLLL